MDTSDYMAIFIRATHNYNGYFLGFMVFVCILIPATVFLMHSSSHDIEIIYMSEKIGLILAIIGFTGMHTCFLVWYLSLPVFTTILFFLHKIDKMSYSDLLSKKQIKDEFYTKKKSFVSTKLYVVLTITSYIAFLIISYFFETIDIGLQVE